MKGKSVLLGMITLVLVFTAAPAFAQKYEVTPYVGGFFARDWRDDFQLDDQFMYGLKGGVFLSDRLELEGNFGYIRHFKFEGVNPDPGTNAWLWEIAPSINFFDSRFGKFVPYLTVGVGGLTGTINGVDDDDDFGEFFDETSVNMLQGAPVIRTTTNPAFIPDNAATVVNNGTVTVVTATPAPSVVMEDGDTFFAISYGGGIKALELAGPMGLRFDLRGRSMPNFFGNHLSWMEMSGGLLFTWGER
jgi:hypothetical protein